MNKKITTASLIVIANLPLLYGIFSLGWEFSDIALWLWVESLILSIFAIKKIGRAVVVDINQKNVLFGTRILEQLKQINILPSTLTVTPQSGTQMFYSVYITGFLLVYGYALFGMALANSLATAATLLVGAIALYIQQKNLYLQYIEQTSHATTKVSYVLQSVWKRLIPFVIAVIAGGLVYKFPDSQMVGLISFTIFKICFEILVVTKNVSMK